MDFTFGQAVYQRQENYAKKKLIKSDGSGKVNAILLKRNFTFRG